MAYSIYSKAGTDEAISSALADSLPTTPADIGAATAAQGALADTAVQPEDLGTAAAADAGDFATAAQGAKADASDVDQITLTGNLVLTLPMGHPAGQVYRAAITQDGVGGHTVTYDSKPVTIDLTAGAATTVELHPVGAGSVVRYPQADLDASRPRYLDAYNDFFGGVSGAHPDARWVNTTHLTHDGLVAWAAWIAGAQEPSGAYVIAGTAPKVVWLGDSWISQEPAVLAAAITSRIAGASVVNAGVSGNTSAQLIARFATDVPADADYVIINEPGVNDIAQGVSATAQAANLGALVALIQGVGAIPVIVGPPPLVDYPARSARRAVELAAQVTAGVGVAAYLDARSAPNQIVPANRTMGVGTDAIKGVATALDVTAVGHEALVALTTGHNNTAIGSRALRTVSVGTFNTAIGQAALGTATAGGSTAVGGNALFAQTTGAYNTAIGMDAGYRVAGDVAKGTTTASYQVAIGYRAGCDATASYAVAIGSSAVASGYGSTAIGAGAVASGAGSVAIGRDNTSGVATASAVNEIALGTALHTVKIAGRLNVAQRTPTGSADTQGAVGDITSDADYLYVKTAAGWKRAALTAW